MGCTYTDVISSAVARLSQCALGDHVRVTGRADGIGGLQAWGFDIAGTATLENDNFSHEFWISMIMLGLCRVHLWGTGRERRTPAL